MTAVGQQSSKNANERFEAAASCLLVKVSRFSSSSGQAGYLAALSRQSFKKHTFWTMAAETTDSSPMYSSISGDKETKLRAAAVCTVTSTTVCKIFQLQFPQALVDDPTMSTALGEVRASKCIL